MQGRALDWIPLDHAAREPVRPGDLISAEAGGTPIYQVVACEPGRAWLAAAKGAPARAAPLERFRWRAVEAAGPR